MGTTEDAERRIITELTQLLKKNADKLLSGETKLCLTTSSLGTISANFRRVSDLSEEDERRELEGRGLITGSINGRLKKKVEDVKLWRDNIRTLQDFVMQTKALKIIHGTYTIRAPVQIARFHSLQVLEVKKVPIHMVEGLSKLRGQLREIIVTRSLQKLQDLFEICGGDRSSGLTWQSLKIANLGFNGLEKLDSSLKYVPFLEVFDLSHNSLKDTEDCLQHLTDLLRINLGFNELTKVPTFSYSIKGLLKTLVLRNNNLDNIEGIEELSALEELDIAHNLLVDHQCLTALSKLKKLMILCLVGNPLSYIWNYRSKTIEYLSPTVSYGIFLLDGQRLTAQETSLLKSSQYRRMVQRESNSYVIVEDLPSSGDSTAVDNVETSNSVDSTRLSVKKKKGHKRVASKERNAIIADIMDGSETEPDIVENKKSSPAGSYIEDPEELERIESEKRKYEIMREHYKDDWLKALQADQGRLPENKTEEQSEPREITADEVKNEESVTVTEESKDGENKGEDEVENDKKQQTDNSEPAVTEVEGSIIQPETAESVTSPPLTEINPLTDIYALRHSALPSRRMEERLLSLDTPDQPKGVEWGRSESQQEEYYGEESAPLIVMLPDQDMKQMFITVNERYITEKNLNGQRCEMLDLKCLQSMKRSEEVLTGRDIIGRILLPVVTLEFDYVKKDMRQRKYAMEDDSFAQEFEELVGKHIKMKELRTQMKELVECLKCQLKFFKPAKSASSAPLLQCPKCKSKMVIELNSRQFDHSSAKESLGNSLPGKDRQENTQHSIHGQPSPTLRRKKGIRKLEESLVKVKRESTEPKISGYGSLPDDIAPQMREKKITQERTDRHRSFRNVTCYEEYDTFQDSIPAVRTTSGTGQSQIKHNSSFSDVTSTRSHSQIKQTSSWSDLRSSGPQSVPRGSVSSVESDIAILATNSSHCSISVISESNKEVIGAGSQIPGSGERVSGHVTSETETDWIRDGQGNITPVGSPLSNSVCSSMVSSVYENTLAAETENAHLTDVQDGILNVTGDNLTGSATGSVMLMQNDENQSEKVSNQIPNIQSSNNQLESNQSGKVDTEVKVILTTEESTSIYETAESSISVNKSYNAGDSISNTVNVPKTNSSTPSIYDSVTSESEVPKTSSPDDQNSSDKCLIRRSAKSRRSFKNKKRSGFYGAENFESSSDNDRRSGFYGDRFDSSTEITDSHLSDKDQSNLHPDLDFPDNISPIKRTSRNRHAKLEHRSAIILDGAENLTGEDSTSLDISQSSVSQSEADVSNPDHVCHSPPAVRLPWEQEDRDQRETTDGNKHETLNHDEFVNVDHRLQLYLELKVFSSTETCQCVLHCDIVQYMKPDAIRSLLVISTNRLLLFEVIGELDSDSDSDWLKCYENQPITELQYVDVGLGYQSLQLEFGTDCSSYTLLIMDGGRCKRFLTLLTDIVQNVSMNEHSKLEGISKSNPTTQENLEVQVLNKEDDTQDLVKYLLVQLMDNEDPDRKETRGLVITYSDIVLVRVNHQWPLPRLQAPLSSDLKGQQFTVLQREHINNIETLEFNEYNPKELRLSFFAEGSEKKVIWVIAMETTQGVKSLVDAIREPWENEFGVSFDITPVSFSEGEQN